MTRAAKVGAIAAAMLAALVVLGFAYKAASRPPAAMERQDFARIATRISSLAAEVQLLAQSVVEDKLTGNYARAHVEHLEEEVHDQEAELDRPAPPGLDAQPLRELRTRLQEELTQAKRHLSEAPAMSRVAAEAGRIRDEARSRTPPK